MLYGPLATAPLRHHWFNQDGLNEYNYVQRVEAALPRFIAYVQWVQKQLSLGGEATALAGFGQGATLALEATLAQPDLAGRVLAFSGCYASLPAVAPAATTLHFLHGANDPVVPKSVMQNVHAHLSDLGGDATLDIASSVGNLTGIRHWSIKPFTGLKLVCPCEAGKKRCQRLKKSLATPMTALTPRPRRVQRCINRVRVKRQSVTVFGCFAKTGKVGIGLKLVNVPGPVVALNGLAVAVIGGFAKNGAPAFMHRNHCRTPRAIVGADNKRAAQQAFSFKA